MVAGAEKEESALAANPPQSTPDPTVEPPSLLDDYAVEREIADRHVLGVSDEVHTGIMGIADDAREGREPPAGNADPVTTALARNARVMIDFDYAASPLVADYEANGATTAEPHPGQRYRTGRGSEGWRTTCSPSDPSRRPRRSNGWDDAGPGPWRSIMTPT